MAAPTLTLENPLCKSFVFHAMLVIVKMLFMSILTVRMRRKKHVVALPEDAEFFAKGPSGQKATTTEDPDVERVRRNHAHDIENIVPFVLVGTFYVLCGPSPWIALWHFRIYSLMKFLHTLCYQRALQPWRALTHLVGFAVLLSMAVQVLITVF